MNPNTKIYEPLKLTVMAKKFKLTIVVETTDEFNPKNFILQDSDVIDGFELTRNGDEEDVTDVFHLKDAYIENIQE